MDMTLRAWEDFAAGEVTAEEFAALILSADIATFEDRVDLACMADLQHWAMQVEMEEITDPNTFRAICSSIIDRWRQDRWYQEVSTRV